MIENGTWVRIINNRNNCQFKIGTIVKIERHFSAYYEENTYIATGIDTYGNVDVWVVLEGDVEVL